MKIAIDNGGFSPSDADQLRRAMATFRRNGKLGNHRNRMVEGMVEIQTIPGSLRQRCFRQIKGFGEYGFPESHAASFALLVYASCWFKTFYPDVFCAAILNSQPMGFYAPAQLVRDAQDHGIEIRDVDVNHSAWDCMLEKSPFDPDQIIWCKHASMREVIKTTHAVRLGFRQIKGLSEERMKAFVERRGSGYHSVRDVWLRSGLDIGEIECLAQGDAFARSALAAATPSACARSTAKVLEPALDQPGIRLRDNEPETKLPIMPLGQHVIHDYRSLGLSLRAHPISFLRRRLDRSGVTPNALLTSVPDRASASHRGLFWCGSDQAREMPSS